ncbi:U6 snRNA-associated Sm LSm2, partial [Haematococcus lacustris]
MCFDSCLTVTGWERSRAKTVCIDTHAERPVNTARQADNVDKCSSAQHASSVNMHPQGCHGNHMYLGGLIGWRLHGWGLIAINMHFAQPRCLSDHTLVGKEVTVELKNDLAITGTLHSVDQYLNIKLVDTRAVNEVKYPHM